MQMPFDMHHVIYTVSCGVYAIMLTVPDAVASLTFTNISDTSVVVIWTQPYFINGILIGMCQEHCFIVLALSVSNVPMGSC